MGLTENQVKQIRALRMKKGRKEQGIFPVEGPKLVEEALNSSAEVLGVYALPGFLPRGIRQQEITAKQLQRISNLSTPNGCFALVKTPSFSVPAYTGQLTLALDRINDPGNLGTILRIADWFGIKEVICSVDSVDFTSPKVVQSSMGAVFRVAVHYVNIEEEVKRFKAEKKGDVLTADMQGTPIYDYQPAKPMLLIMGSESHGVLPGLKALSDVPLHIPGEGRAESLNVAVSTGIICSALLR